MQYINKKDLSERWQCHPTNIDYHTKMKRIRSLKRNNKMVYNMEDVCRLEIERQWRIKIPVKKVILSEHFWKRFTNKIKSCFR